MNWLNHLFIFLLGCSLNSHSQENSSWKDNFDHYQGSYESNFVCGKKNRRIAKTQVTNLSFGFNCGYLSVTLSNSGGYEIHLEGLRRVNDSLILEEFQFKGVYTIDKYGNLMLYGEHPFKKSTLEIKEIQKRKNGVLFITDRSFSYRFNNQFKWITRKKRSTYCDGCRLTPDD